MAIEMKNKVFSLETANTLYQMKVDEYGVLYHLWYGAKTGCCMDYRLDYPDVGFSGNIPEAGNRRTYSLDTLPLEYAASGVSDFRVPAISVTHADGSTALDLRFESARVVEGKYSIEGLPAVYADEKDAQTLEIVLKDVASELRVVLLYGVLAKEDVITRSVRVENRGDQEVVLDRVHSMCLDLPYGDWDWVHFHGRHTMERQVERLPIAHGIQESGSRRGTSSHQQNPTVLLCESDCTEQSGVCIGAALMYSGGFQAQVEKDQMEQVRLVMGIHPDTFAWTLAPGEHFNAPEVILSCSTQGLARLSQQFHHVIRHHVCRGEYQLSKRPVLINNWEATYFDFNEEKIYHIAKQAAELGIDMMVLDDGWFGKRDDDVSGLGDWFVNENKMKGGLKALIERVNGLGMKFGIWFEPEMVSEDSDLYRAHPEWAIQVPGRAPARSRYQLVLDFSRPEVVDYLYERMSTILRENHIEYVKWDMNRSICDWYTATLPAARQKEMPHRYVLGLYALLERLTSEFPHVLFEGCSGGGGRFDAGMMYYCPQIWCSDDTDAFERTMIQYGTSFFYPISTVGSHVSAVPNHQTGRITSIDTRGVVAMAGSFGYELDLNRLSDEEKQAVAEQVKTYKKHQPLIYDGKYYRLIDPFAGELAAWQWTAQDGSEVLVQGVVFRTRPNTLRRCLKLTGLEAGARYRVEGTEAVYTAEALMNGGILLPRTSGDNQPFTYHLVKEA